jgi:putative ABC transport system ATP-binding protein
MNLAASASAQAEPGGSLLRIRALELRRGRGAEVFRLRLPQLELRRGELLAVTGRSGSGKSTLVEALGLVLAPVSVEQFALATSAGPADLAAMWHAGDETGLSRLRARQLGFVLQGGGLLPFLSVAQNIALSRRLAGLPADASRARELAARLGIAALLERKPGALSTGERQRASIARALAHAPALLLADEPTAALDPEHAARVFALLLQLAREQGIAALVCTHDWDTVRRLGLRELRASHRHDAQGSYAQFAEAA